MMAIRNPAFLWRCIHRNGTDRSVQIAENALFRATSSLHPRFKTHPPTLLCARCHQHHSKIMHKFLSIRDGELRVRIQNA
jgi:hypothetical protein